MGNFEYPEYPEQSEVVQHSNSSKMRRAAERVAEWWKSDDRPGMLEVHYYYLPMAMAAGVLAVGVADEAFDTHLAENMSHVRIDPHANDFEQFLQNTVRQIGQEAVELENG